MSFWLKWKLVLHIIADFNLEVFLLSIYVFCLLIVHLHAAFLLGFETQFSLLDSSFVGKDHPFILDVMNTYQPDGKLFQTQ